MWEKIGLTGLVCFIWAVSLWIASKNGSKAAQLEALKIEIKKRAKEQERAHAISNAVDNKPIDNVRERLQDLKRE